MAGKDATEFKSTKKLDTKPRKRAKPLPPARERRSRSCSSLCKRNDLPVSDPPAFPPAIDHISQQNVDGENDHEIDNGNDLVHIMKGKLNLASPIQEENNSVDEHMNLSPMKELSLNETLASNTSAENTCYLPEPQSNHYATMIQSMIEGYQNTICTIIKNTDERYQHLITTQQQQIERLSIQQNEQFLAFQKTVMQQQQIFQHKLNSNTKSPDAASPISPTIITEELTIPAGATNKNNIKSKKTPQQQQQQKQQHEKREHDKREREQLTQEAKSVQKQAEQENLRDQQLEQQQSKQQLPQQHSQQQDAQTQQQQVPPNHQQNSPKQIQSMVLGSSIVKHVRGGVIKHQSGIWSKICCFPGAGAEKITDHAEVELKYSLPETAIIHCGGNDLANGLEVIEIIENIHYLGGELKEQGVKNIAISGMVPRIYMQKSIPKLNNALRALSSRQGYNYIDNSNISFWWHLSEDGIHLNPDGVKLLERNYANYLKKTKMELVK